MKNIDFLSPPITLFHFKQRTHTSKIGGILIISMLLSCLIYVSTILYNIFTYDDFTSMYYKKFENEAGYYSFNTSSAFHFFQFFNSANEGYFDEYDPKNIRIITAIANKDSDLEINDHWVYDKCDEKNDNFDKSLFSNIKNFSNAACIKYFYNSKNKKYISIENNDFIWPHMEHGSSQKDNIYLSTVIVKCDNFSITNKIFGNCNTEQKINKFINSHPSIYLYFKDNLVDPIDYKNPIKSYFYVLSSATGKGITFVENYVHFSPLKLITNEGAILRKKSYANSYIFDQNRKGEGKNYENDTILVKYYHLIQNKMEIYERKYNNILDAFSDIGGVIQLVYYFFYGLNYIYNKYIIIIDTNNLLFNTENKSNKSNIINLKKNKSCNNKKSKNTSQLRSINYFSKSQKNLDFQINNIINNINKPNNLGLDDKINSPSFFKPNVNNILCNKLNNSEQKLEQNISFNINNDNSKIEINGINKNKNYYEKDVNKFIVNKDTKNLISSVRLSNNFEIINERRIIRSSNVLEKYQEKENNLKKYNDLIKLESGFPKYYEDVCYSRGGKTIINKYNNFMSLDKGFSFFNWLKKTCEKDIHNNMSALTDFRMKLISEEHIFKAHITIVLLEKQYKIKPEQQINLISLCQEL